VKGSLRPRRKKRIDHREACHVHTMRNAWDRLGLTLTRQDIEDIIAMVQSNQCEFLGRENSTRTAWRLEFRGRTVKVVYDSKLNALRTIMRDDMVTRAERKQAA